MSHIKGYIPLEKVYNLLGKYSLHWNDEEGKVAVRKFADSTNSFKLPVLTSESGKVRVPKRKFHDMLEHFKLGH